MDFYKFHMFVKITADLMFVNGTEFLITSEMKIDFITI